ncbi:hypothetical protein N8940_01200 [Sphingomonadaceae bacterium]|nr:hypothetical protein [Sphingomonadaceae bacterium]
MFAIILFGIFTLAAIVSVAVLSDSALRGVRIHRRLRGQVPVTYGSVSVIRTDTLDDLALGTSRPAPKIDALKANRSPMARQFVPAPACLMAPVTLPATRRAAA